MQWWIGSGSAFSDAVRRTLNRLQLSPQEPPPCLHGYVVTLLEVSDQSHRNVFGIATLCLPVALLRRIEQLLDFEFLGQGTCLGHNAARYCRRHVNQCLA